VYGVYFLAILVNKKFCFKLSSALQDNNLQKNYFWAEGATKQSKGKCNCIYVIYIFKHIFVPYAERNKLILFLWGCFLHLPLLRRKQAFGGPNIWIIFGNYYENPVELVQLMCRKIPIFLNYYEKEGKPAGKIL
jgi:hypothetical protein